MLKAPLNLAILGDAEAAQFCDTLGLAEIFGDLATGCSTGPTVLFSDDLTDLAIDASGTFTRASIAYHQQPDGTLVSIASGAPRWKGARWTGSAWSKLDALGNQLPGPFGLLMEPVRTNYLHKSNPLTWSIGAMPNGGTLSDSGIASPISGVNYIKSVPGISGGGSHCAYSSQTLPSNAPFWCEFYAKSAEYSFLWVDTNDGAINATRLSGVCINLTTGAVGSQPYKAILDYYFEAQPDGGWKIGIKFPALTLTPATINFTAMPANGSGRSFDGDGTSGALVQGFMSVLIPHTGFIPTTSAPVACAVDALAYSGIANDNETRLAYVSGNMDVDDWNGSVPVPTAPTTLQSVAVYAPGERPA